MLKRVVLTTLIISLGIMFVNLSVVYAEKIKLTWWTEYSEPVLLESLKNTVEIPYESLNPNVDLVIESFGDYERVLATAMAGGGGPDIFDLYGPAYAIEYADSGKILLLDEYVDRFGWRDEIFPWALKCSTYKGHLTSLPVHYETMLLWYNKTMFQEKGWQVPTDWDSLVKLCELQSSEGIIPFALGTADFVVGNSWMYSIFFNHVPGSDYLRKVLTGEKKWTDEPMKKAVEKYVYLWQNGWISQKQSQALTMNDAWGLWQSKRAAMKLEGTWAFSYIRQNSEGFEWDWAPIPSLEDGIKPPVVIGIGSSIAVNATTENPDVAVGFLDFLFSNPELAARRIEEVGGELWLPIELDKEDFSPSMDERFVRAFDWIAEGVKTGNIGYTAWTFFPPKTDAFLYQNLDSVVLGKMSIDDYLSKAQDIFDVELSKGKVPPLP